jgi:RNA polymerase sigma-70 factor (ECF subfamily)
MEIDKKQIPSDGDIVNKVLNGNRESFAGLVERHLPAAFSVALATSNNSSDAEDAVQDAFLAAFTSLHTLREPDKFRPWLLKITRNRMLRQVRRKPDCSDSIPQPMEAEDPSAAVQRQEFFALLNDSIGALREKEQETILLHYFSGLTTHEIAESLDVGHAAVLKRLQRGRAHLGERLLKRMEDPDAVAEVIRPQVVRVIHTILAASVSWKTASVLLPAGALSAIFLNSPKVSTSIIAAVVLLTSLIGWHLLRDIEQEQVVSTEQEDIGFDSVSKAATESTLNEEVVDVAPLPETTAAKQEPTTENSNTDTEAGEDDSESYTSVTGDWIFQMRMAGVERGTIKGHMDESGGQLRIAMDSMVGQAFVHSATKNGNRMKVTILDHQSRIEVAGEINEAMTEVLMVGSLVPEGDESPWQREGVNTMEVTIYAKRVSESQRVVEEAKGILLELFDAALQYAFDHDGLHPDELNDLIPQYASDQRMVDIIRRDDLTYTPPPAIPFDEFAHAVIQATDPNDLMALEAELVELWGDNFMEPVQVLVGSFDELETVIRVDSSGNLTLSTDEKVLPGNEPTSHLTKEQKLAWNAVCSQNVLALERFRATFVDDQAGRLMPPGWRSLYPDYMPNVSLLTCPSVDPQTLSYRVVFPAVPEERVIEIAKKIEGLSEYAELEEFLPRIPVIIETHECSSSGGRHVIFLDGHLERVPLEDWDARIAPYLDAEVGR